MLEQKSGTFPWKHLQSDHWPGVTCQCQSVLKLNRRKNVKWKKKTPSFCPPPLPDCDSRVNCAKTVPQNTEQFSRPAKPGGLSSVKQCCGTSVTGVMVFHKPFFLFVKMVFGTLSNTPVTQMYINNMYFNLLMSYNKYDRQSFCFVLINVTWYLQVGNQDFL